ncbi:hypothetical protein NDU88_003160 [Pleurodeles waltl]|uniref:Uncharacterized protein n=1 Tax=Pleurodeles waltl TaxID=8319 RepID=A0AAV7UBR4_PLEWA|nr:hypothetical protein NDU88_003160 [Pleurodeles waltl]
MFHLKRLKWRQTGIAAVMDEVYQKAGSLQERTNLVAKQQKEPTLTGDWNEDWAELSCGLLLKFPAAHKTALQRLAFDSKRFQDRQPWFNKAFCTHKLQIVQQARQLVKAISRGIIPSSNNTPLCLGEAGGFLCEEAKDYRWNAGGCPQPSNAFSLLQVYEPWTPGQLVEFFFRDFVLFPALAIYTAPDEDPQATWVELSTLKAM